MEELEYFHLVHSGDPSNPYPGSPAKAAAEFSAPGAPPVASDDAGAPRPLPIELPTPSPPQPVKQSSAQKDVDAPDLEVPEGTESYKFKSKLGKALIINIKDFDKKENGKRPKTREGTEKDEEKLMEVLDKIGIVWDDREVLKGNVKQKNIIDELNKAAKYDYTDYSYFCCFVMSHGGNMQKVKRTVTCPHSHQKESEGEKKESEEEKKEFEVEEEEIVKNFFSTSDNKTISFEDLAKHFQGNPSLQEKPKLFFIQTCQGNDDDPGVRKPEKQKDSEEDDLDPTHADTFIFYASQPGYASYRCSKNGSNFMQCLCKVLEKHFSTAEITEIGLMVNSMVAKCSNIIDKENCKQISMMTSSLRKKFYFVNQQK